MSLDREQPNARPIASVEELVAYFRGAERPRSEHQIGLEHEKLVYPVGSAAPVPYEGPRGIGALLAQLQPLGYEAFREAPDQPVIALTCGASTISLEPGGQLELSGKPTPTARAAHAENQRHIRQVKQACQSLGLRVVALGYRPHGTVNQMPWMPKTRYRAMRETLSRRGRLALDMMLMTATGQVSLDWADEADCVQKVTVVARLTPVMVALFANSPLAAGKRTGYMSYRSRVWSEVDPARCGYLPSMFDGSFSYRAYVEWALDAPLLFLRRGEAYLRPELTFRQLLERGFEGQPAFHSDWVDHLSTLFPEVRIKKVLEIRGADCVPTDLTGALAAIWRGLLYDPRALQEADRLLPQFSYQEHLQFHSAAREQGLAGSFRELSFAALAREMVGVARRGLARLDPEDAPLLDPLAELAESGHSLAERVIKESERQPDPGKFLNPFEL
jgi:glutamate--cysteine ligase